MSMSIIDSQEPAYREEHEIDVLTKRIAELEANDGGRESYGERTRVAIDDWMAVKDGRESRWHELFGTPERAARTLITVRKECEDIGTCYPNCPFDDAPACPSSIEPRDYDALLEWLGGDAE